MISTATPMQKSASFDLGLHTSGLVKVIHGANDDVFGIVGATVRSVRKNLFDAFNLSEEVIAFVGARQVADSYVLQESDRLEFVRQWGRKAGRSRLTEKDLQDCNLTVIGKQAFRLEDTTPDSSWTVSRLATYVKERIASSESAEKESLLQAKKSAVELFRAGSALSIARAKCEEMGHGEWTKWMREHDLAATTVNDAIRLYTNAKTEDALKGLGVTEAKTKFVYPVKTEDAVEDNEEASPAIKPTKRKPAAKASTQETAAPEEVNRHDLSDGDGPLAAEVEAIARRLNEIAQNAMQQVDWSEEDQKRFEEAAAAVAASVSNLYASFNHEFYGKAT